MVKLQESNSSFSSRNSSSPLRPLATQRQYLTVPTSVEMMRTSSEQSLELDDRNTFWLKQNTHDNRKKRIFKSYSLKACSCIALVFLFCVITVFIYAVLISKYSSEPTICNDSLLESLPDVINSVD